MPRLLPLRISLLAAAATLAVAAPASAACDGADVGPTASNLVALGQTTVCLVNEQRGSNGLAPLSQNALLAAAAARHNHDMVTHGFFDHTGQDGTTIRERVGATGYLLEDTAWTIGENLAWGTGGLGSPRAVVAAWMNSAGHRANILNESYREIGIAVDFGVPDRSLAELGGATYTTAFGAVVPQPAEPVAVTRPHAKPRKKTVRCKTKKQKRTRVCKLRARRAAAAR